MYHDVHIRGIAVVPVSAIGRIYIGCAGTGCVGKCWSSYPVAECETRTCDVCLTNTSGGCGKSCISQGCVGTFDQEYVTAGGMCEHYGSGFVDSGTDIGHIGSTHSGFKIRGGLAQYGHCDSGCHCGRFWLCGRQGKCAVGHKHWGGVCACDHCGTCGHTFKYEYGTGEVVVGINLCIGGASWYDLAACDRIQGIQGRGIISIYCATLQHKSAQCSVKAFDLYQHALIDTIGLLEHAAGGFWLRVGTAPSWS